VKKTLVLIQSVNIINIKTIHMEQIQHNKKSPCLPEFCIKC